MTLYQRTVEGGRTKVGGRTRQRVARRSWVSDACCFHALSHTKGSVLVPQSGVQQEDRDVVQQPDMWAYRPVVLYHHGPEHGLLQ